MITGVSCQGHLAPSRLKELMSPLPVVYLKAVIVDSAWEASSVGYLRHNDDTYECPVYQTTFRGPTYVFLATMAAGPKPQEGDDPAVLAADGGKSKWVLGGVAIMMQTDS